MSALKNIAQLITCCLLAPGAHSQALDAPSLDCASVSVSGNVALNWTPPADPANEFVEYQLFGSSDGVNFNIVTTIANLGTNSFIHAGAGADAGSMCYYMVAISDDGTTQTSEPSDTLCTIHLTLEQSNPEGYALLEWEMLLPPSDPGATFDIYMEFPAGTWTPLINVPVALDQYAHEVSTCGEFLSFLVSLNTAGGCAYQSNIEGDFFNDTTAPEIPEITSVSVDSLSGNAVITWNAADAGDTDGYILYQCVGGFTVILDTLWGQFNTQYENLNSTASSSGPESYTVASFDTCLVGNPPSPNTSPTSSTCNSSMFLVGSWFDCDADVNLAWTPYIGWTNGVSFYEVYVKENGNAPQLLGIVDGDTETYTHSGVVAGISYQYFIKAYASGGGYDALSSTWTLNIASYQGPDYVYLSSATVVDKTTVDVRVFLTSTPDTFVFRLQRYDEDDDEWDNVTAQSIAGVNYLEFTDGEVNTDLQSYTYRILIENNCGDSVNVSNIGQTIFAQGLANSGRMVNTLTWTEYFDWDGGVNEYRIYRSIEGFETDNLIAVVNQNNLFYEDDVIDYLLTPGEFCYVIEGLENTNFLGITETSRSNEVCVTQDPKIWIPNAFIVNGINNAFKPVISFADFDAYTMIIYNRWGSEIFRTNDILEGWDGTVNGDLVQEGQYAYYISVVDGFGNFYERKGAVVMLVGAE